MVDIDLGMFVDLGIIVVGVAVVVGRTRISLDLRVVEDMKDGREFAEAGNRKLKTDLGHRMFGIRKDLVIAVRRNLRNHPL